MRRSGVCLWLGVIGLAVVGGPAAESGQAPDAVRRIEAYSVFGDPLFAPELSADARQRLESDLAQAEAQLQKAPHDVDALIWVGRRLAYLGRHRDAIEVFTRGIAEHPREPRLYRHRGHRYITLREFGRAVSDLELASRLIVGTPDQIEPDGAPNPIGKPRSSTHSNIWYHLGLAHYLGGGFERAAFAYRELLKIPALNDDMRCATSDWLYMTLRRLGRDREAAEVLEPIREQMDIIENQAYHRRLLMYKGLLKPETLLDPAGEPDPLNVVTQGYGVGNWYLYNGRTERAVAVFERVLQSPSWGAFGYIAAEVDLKRLKAR